MMALGREMKSVYGSTRDLLWPEAAIFAASRQLLCVPNSCFSGRLTPYSVGDTNEWKHT